MQQDESASSSKELVASTTTPNAPQPRTTVTRTASIYSLTPENRGGKISCLFRDFYIQDEELYLEGKRLSDCRAIRKALDFLAEEDRTNPHAAAQLAQLRADFIVKETQAWSKLGILRPANELVFPSGDPSGSQLTHEGHCPNFRAVDITCERIDDDSTAFFNMIMQNGYETSDMVRDLRCRREKSPEIEPDRFYQLYPEILAIHHEFWAAQNEIDPSKVAIAYGAHLWRYIESHFGNRLEPFELWGSRAGLTLWLEWRTEQDRLNHSEGGLRRIRISALHPSRLKTPSVRECAPYQDRVLEAAFMLAGRKFKPNFLTSLGDSLKVRVRHFAEYDVHQEAEENSIRALIQMVEHKHISAELEPEQVQKKLEILQRTLEQKVKNLKPENPNIQIEDPRSSYNLEDIESFSPRVTNSRDDTCPFKHLFNKNRSPLAPDGVYIECVHCLSQLTLPLNERTSIVLDANPRWTNTPGALYVGRNLRCTVCQRHSAQFVPVAPIVPFVSNSRLWLFYRTFRHHDNEYQKKLLKSYDSRPSSWMSSDVILERKLRFKQAQIAANPARILVFAEYTASTTEWGSSVRTRCIKCKDGELLDTKPSKVLVSPGVATKEAYLARTRKCPKCGGKDVHFIPENASIERILSNTLRMRISQHKKTLKARASEAHGAAAIELASSAVDMKSDNQDRAEKMASETLKRKFEEVDEDLEEEQGQRAQENQDEFQDVDIEDYDERYDSDDPEE